MNKLLTESVSNDLALIIKELVYKQYGLECSQCLRWINGGATWVYDIVIDNIDDRQYTLVCEYVQGIVNCYTR